MFGTSFALLLEWILIFTIFGFRNPEIAVRIRLKVFKTKPLVSVCHAMLEIHWKHYPLYGKQKKILWFSIWQKLRLKILVLDAGNDGQWSRWSKMLKITEHFNYRSERTNAAKDWHTTMLSQHLYRYTSVNMKIDESLPHKLSADSDCRLVVNYWGGIQVNQLSPLCI